MNNHKHNMERDVHDNDVGILHPAWRAFIRYCQEMRHGEIERLKIQDGVPVLAEIVERKIKFAA